MSGADIRKTLEPFSATNARGHRLVFGRHSAAVAPDRSKGSSRENSLCPNCEDRTPAFDCVVSSYQAKGVLRDLIHRFKYGRQFYLRRVLAEFLVEAMQDARMQAESGRLSGPRAASPDSIARTRI